VKIYTRTGDDGGTALFGGGRVSKAAPRVETYGTVDELNAVLGWAVTQMEDDTLRGRIERVQHDLFALGADLATPPPEENRRRPETPPLPQERVEEMEAWIDEAESELPELKAFILPGGTTGAAALHVARTVCRRAERMVVALASQEAVDAGVIQYLNRLADLLFMVARLENHRAGVGDVEWRQE
jgi:cob(I)alamin adenosyltransferase